ncbi:MAG: hypothetical protein OEZ02_07640, partial [Anaerolineae bacterium]|nr:hypothetical protein [Anaerolineae bacterium]
FSSKTNCIFEFIKIRLARISIRNREDQGADLNIPMRPRRKWDHFSRRMEGHFPAPWGLQVYGVFSYKGDLRQIDLYVDCDAVMKSLNCKNASPGLR